MYDREPFVPATTGLSLKDFAFHRMRDAIRNCEFEPGKFVSENEFSETLGLGKAAVRDALAKLAAASLVISNGRSGWQVAPISGQCIGEVIELRRRLEPCLAGIDYDEADLDKLSGLAGLRNLQEAVQDNRQALETLVHYDRSFMETLAGLSGRDLLVRWLNELWDRSSQIYVFLSRTAAQPIKLPDRGGLVAALRERDHEKAERCLLEGVENFENWAVKALLNCPVNLHEETLGPERVREKRKAPTCRSKTGTSKSGTKEQIDAKR